MFCVSGRENGMSQSVREREGEGERTLKTPKMSETRTSRQKGRESISARWRGERLSLQNSKGLRSNTNSYDNQI